MLAVVVLSLAAVGGAAILQRSGGSLTHQWTSDTARNNSVNHHAVGAGEGVVVAPVAATPGDDRSRYSCSLVSLAPESGARDWRAGVPPDQCFTHALTQPAVGDVDGDGRPEVVAASTENVAVVYAADGTEQSRIGLSTYGYSRPTLADLTGDGQSEIIATDIGGTVVVAAGNGTVHWRRTVSDAVWDAPAIGDVDGDDAPEIVVGGIDETVALDPDGTVVWNRSVEGNDVTLVAADGDDALEVAVTGGHGVTLLDGPGGDPAWTTEMRGEPSLHDAGDGDDDGDPELYVGTPGNVVRALDATDGTREWESRLATEENVPTPAPVLGDLTGDGQLELLAVTNGGRALVLDPGTGEKRASYERSVPIWTFATLADVTDDPGQEILLRYGDGRVVALAYEA